MARKYIVGGRIVTQTDKGRKFIVGGKVVTDSTAAAAAAGQLLSIGSNLTGGHTPLRGGMLT